MDDIPLEETEELEPVLVSALEHYSYCPRQCALIHIEQTFEENIYTVQGHLLHERVDESTDEIRHDIRIERGLSLWSKHLGLVGRADVVEFHVQHPSSGGRGLKPSTMARVALLK